MAQFSYRAKNKLNKVAEGTVDAETSSIAQDILNEHGYEVISLQLQKKTLLNFNFVLGRVGSKDLVIFSRQLAVLISAKLPVVDALRNAVRQTVNKKLKKVLIDVSNNVEGGTKLSNALDQFPRVFSGFFVNIIRSGETSGRLEEVLNYLADQMEKDYELNSRIKSTLIYPAFILSALFILGIMMMVFVIPKLTEMLIQTGADLPLSTRILIGVSSFLQDYWLVLFGLIIVSIVAFKMALRTLFFKTIFDRLLISLPVFGRLFRYIYVVRITRSLRTLLMGGVTLDNGLEIVSRVPGNEIYRKLILETKAAVEDGQSVSSVFEKSHLIPQMVPQMLSSGEESGQMSEVLDKLSDFFNREVTNMVENLVALLEPTIMVILGVAVGIMVAAIILPMYNLSANL